MITEIYRGTRKIARIEGEDLWVSNDQAGDCRLVLALVQLGIPVDRSADNEYSFWRIQVSDPDFPKALKEYLEVKNRSFGLTVDEPGHEESQEDPVETI